MKLRQCTLAELYCFCIVSLLVTPYEERRRRGVKVVYLSFSLATSFSALLGDPEAFPDQMGCQPSSMPYGLLPVGHVGTPPQGCNIEAFDSDAQTTSAYSFQSKGAVVLLRAPFCPLISMTSFFGSLCKARGHSWGLELVLTGKLRAMSSGSAPLSPRQSRIASAWLTLHQLACQSHSLIYPHSVISIWTWVCTLLSRCYCGGLCFVYLCSTSCF